MKKLVAAIAVVGLIVIQAQADEFFVASSAELSSALSEAGPGDSIVWRDGVYYDQQLVFSGNGTAGDRITFRAETPGGVTFRGKSRLSLSGDFADVQGFNWEGGELSGGNPILEFRRSSDHAHHSRVSQCVFRDYLDPERDESKYVSIYGQHNQFDSNHVSGKRNNGAMVVVWATDVRSDETMSHRIENNLIGDIARNTSNGWEALRIGTSARSSTDGQVVVDGNYFYRASGEIEIVSNKTQNNTFSNNVFRESRGNLTLRHGNGSTVDSNWFFGAGLSDTSGIRAYGEDHVISNNYLQDLNGDDLRAAIVLMAGDPNAPANGAQSVRNVDIVHNTIVNNLDESFRFGANANATRIVGPEDIRIANNIVLSKGSRIVEEELNSSVTYSSNIFFGADPGVDASGIATVDPLLESTDSNVFRPSATSPAVNAATSGAFADVAFDIHGQLRQPIGQREIGADELYASARGPVEPENVGPEWYRPLTWRAKSQRFTIGSAASFSGAVEQGAGHGSTWEDMRIDVAVAGIADDSGAQWRVSPFGEMVYIMGEAGVAEGDTIDVTLQVSEALGSGYADAVSPQAVLFNFRDYHDALPDDSDVKVTFQINGRSLDMAALLNEDIVDLESALGASNELVAIDDGTVRLAPKQSGQLFGGQFRDANSASLDFIFDSILLELTAGSGGIAGGSALWFNVGGAPVPEPLSAVPVIGAWLLVGSIARRSKKRKVA